MLLDGMTIAHVFPCLGNPAAMQRLARTGVVISRIAYGMPLGGDLEYADHVTVGRSLENRRKFSD